MTIYDLLNITPSAPPPFALHMHLLSPASLRYPPRTLSYSPFAVTIIEYSYNPLYPFPRPTNTFKYFISLSICRYFRDFTSLRGLLARSFAANISFSYFQSIPLMLNPVRCSCSDPLPPPPSRHVSLFRL